MDQKLEHDSPGCQLQIGNLARKYIFKNHLQIMQKSRVSIRFSFFPLAYWHQGPIKRNEELLDLQEQSSLWDVLPIHIYVTLHLCAVSITRMTCIEWWLPKSPCNYCKWQWRQLHLLLHSLAKNKLWTADSKRDRELIFKCV